jgi:tetratricopeptide (TPR) repeat protein
MSSPLAVSAQSGPDAAVYDRAASAFQNGDSAAALALLEGILARSPENANALYFSALVHFHMGNLDAARGRLERAVRLAGNFFAAWELMVQVAQAQGDLVRREEAIDRLKIAVATAIDPEIRRKGDFIRDRIRVGDQDLAVVDYFVRGGNDFTRYQIGPGDPRTHPDRGFLLRTDTVTTENWKDTALLPPDTQLFHLDLVEAGPDGADKVAIYQYYVGEPDYDTVRAEVMRILRGESRPLSGVPGKLAGSLK